MSICAALQILPEKTPVYSQWSNMALGGRAAGAERRAPRCSRRGGEGNKKSARSVAGLPVAGREFVHHPEHKSYAFPLPGGVIEASD
jgi:hypothetical protein